MAAAYSSFQGAQSSAGVCSGKRALSAPISARSTGVPAPASSQALVTAACAVATASVSSCSSNASQFLL